VSEELGKKNDRLVRQHQTVGGIPRSEDSSLSAPPVYSNLEAWARAAYPSGVSYMVGVIDVGEGADL
jgi:hypothetical protein